MLLLARNFLNFFSKLIVCFWRIIDIKVGSKEKEKHKQRKNEYNPKKDVY